MQLVIYGRDPADTLVQWAKSIFAGVPDRNAATPTFPTTSFPAPDFTQRIVYYRPVADTNTIVLYWQTPPLAPHYRQSVASFLSRYLGDEGSGSLLQYLRTQGWASGIIAGSEVDTESYTLLSVAVDLTEPGLPRVGEVIAAVFQYVRLLQSQTDSELAALWEDWVSVQRIIFDYQPKTEPSDYVT